MAATAEQGEAALNELCKEGKMFDMLDGYYAEDCVFQEADGNKRRGRAAQIGHLKAFFATLKRFNGATLHAAATGPDVGMSEWTFDMTGPDGQSIIWNEILVRRWRNGKVASERFYRAD
jgi:ketosteroid isomerase-like protein